MNKNDELRDASGGVRIDHDKLTEFLYDLMKCHVPVAIVEELRRSSEGGEIKNFVIFFMVQTESQ